MHLRANQGQSLGMEHLQGADSPNALRRRQVVVAVDQGTTNTKAVLVDAVTGVALRVASRPVAIEFPAPGWVQQDPDELWAATLAAATECLKDNEGLQPVGLAISNQRESVVCWSRKSGVPLGPVLGWQDARTADWCADLAARRPEEADLVRWKTGLSLDPMFSAPKFRAAIDGAEKAGADPDDLAVGTVDSWLVWRLTGQHLTEVGNASRTLLLDLRTLAWDQSLAEFFGVPLTALPTVVDSDGGFGYVGPDCGLLNGLPVVSILADSHAALYHHGCRELGTGKATYGTGSSVMSVVATGDLPDTAPAGVATTIAWRVAGEATYAREGNIVATGAALDWVAAMLGAPVGVSGGSFLTELASTVPDAGGVSFVPAFSGLGAPYWDRGATGILNGLNAGTSRGHVARAALESVAHQIADVVDAMESDGAIPIALLQADGGATASRLLMQIQADLLGRPVQVALSSEASALGAALLAARTLGFATPDAEPGDCFSPIPASAADRMSGREAWAHAIARSRGLPVSPNRRPDQNLEGR
jgi:glycerol kinase